MPDQLHAFLYDPWRGHSYRAGHLSISHDPSDMWCVCLCVDRTLGKKGGKGTGFSQAAVVDPDRDSGLTLAGRKGSGERRGVGRGDGDGRLGCLCTVPIMETNDAKQVTHTTITSLLLLILN